ncbi:Crp/Fnr family transcriptional regulator [Pseudomonas wenzhouensis]|uniref:Crp/Fnr family transcriptional regulator n=1 Tax=Pseudomonas wenzhouensis TaxID=2906062 RepID=UPI001E3C937B|nr:Crp/Fnr family transcriptional regulator [Pseudomonas wenzhouensis]UFQ98958.1 Crp/Fnr family transcriptional regulator [Pseudomonas wenzhouensis]
MTNQPWYWQRLTLFDNCEAAARQALLAIAEQQVLHAKQMVFRADDPPERVYLVEQGLIKVFSLTPQGEMVTLWFCGAQEPFGAGGIAGVGPQSVFAQAVGHCVIWSMKRSDFEQVLKAYPELALNTIRLVSGRMRLATDALVESISCNPEQRLARMLLRLACQCATQKPEGLAFELRLTHQELAQMVGSSRQTVNRVLNRYAAEGVLSVVQRRLVIHQPETLARRASA